METLRKFREPRTEDQLKRMTNWKTAMNGGPPEHMQFLACDQQKPLDSEFDRASCVSTAASTEGASACGEPPSRKQQKKNRRVQVKMKFETIRAAFAPIAALLLVKYLDMELASTEADKFKRYMSQPRNCSFEAWCEEGDLREERLRS